MRYFDSHAHYYDERFESECEGSVDELIGALLSDSVSYIVNVGTMPSTSRLAIEQAKKFQNMYSTVGIHPGDTRFLSDLDSELAECESMLRDPASKCVCLGEIGLGYHYDGTDKEKQMRYFRAQMELARSLDIPISIHDREAHGDCFDVICRHPGVRGVFHSYSGSAEMARDLVRRGWYVSFSGVITFQNAPKVREAAAAVPLDRLLIETDAPYLTPVPHRGELNHSGMMQYTAAALAAVKELPTDEIVRITAENARALFQI